MTPIDTIREVRVSTIEEAIKANTPSLGLMKREKGENYTIGYLKLWLIYLQGNLNIKNKLSEDMIDLAAEMIYEDFKHLCIADVRKVVTDALKGVYGEFYESLSIPKIISWFTKYSDERCDIFEAMSMQDHSVIKNKIDYDVINVINERRTTEEDNPDSRPEGDTSEGGDL